jgi:hypothetical protein
MVWIIWGKFTREWLNRAERGEGEFVDDVDRFISLWIAFNGWMKGKFGEGENDAELLKKAGELPEFNACFEHLRENDPDFRENLEKITNYSVGNMRDPEAKGLIYKHTLKSLIEVLYRVRCNLFHGRKQINEDEKDKKLVSLSLNILLPLFKTYLSRTKELEV